MNFDKPRKLKDTISTLDPYTNIRVYSDVTTSRDRRVINELGMLYFQCRNIIVERCGEEDVVHVTHNAHSYVIKLDEHYPFKPPFNITVNGTHFKRVCNFTEGRLPAVLKRYYGNICICCDSIFGDRWSPSFRMVHLINEIENYILMKREVFMRILCDSLRRKHNCLEEFACFESYLFVTLPPISRLYCIQ